MSSVIRLQARMDLSWQGWASWLWPAGSPFLLRAASPVDALGVSGPGERAIPTPHIHLSLLIGVCFSPFSSCSSFCPSDKPTGPQLSHGLLGPSVLELILRRHCGELPAVLPTSGRQLAWGGPSR